MHRMPFKTLVDAPPPLRLAGGRPALLVVDFQGYAADPAAGLGRLAAERGLEAELAEYREQVAFARRNVADLLRAFRARGRPVIFSRRVAPSPVSEPGDGDPPSGRTWLPPWVAGDDDPDAAIVPDLQPAAGEPVVTRAAESPFAGGGLHRALAGAGADGLLVGGLFLPGAVDLAVREAAGRGLPVVLVLDACAAETYALHECLSAQLAGGPVRLRSTAAMLDLLEGAPA